MVPSLQRALLLALAALASATPLVERQDSDADGISVNGWRTDDVATTTVHTAPWESVFPVTIIVSGSITRVNIETITLYPTGLTGSSSTGTQADNEAQNPETENRDGAIAGGVVGAVVVAAIAVVLYVHFRNKKSPKHWRNRGDAGRWSNLEGKGGHGPNFAGDVKAPIRPIVATVPSPRSAAPVFIREHHRRSSSNPFEDPATPSARKELDATFIELERKA